MRLSQSRIRTFVVFGIYWAGGLIAATALSAEEAGLPPTAPHLTVRVYDYVGIPEGALVRSIEAARMVYSKIGIRTTWINCLQRPERPVHPSCSERPDISHIRVRLHHASDATKLGAPAAAAGYAITDSRSGFGSTTLLFYERILDLSQRSKVSEDTLLGYMMAHEIGHLLLGRDSHGHSGIMRAPWRRVELRAVATGSLNFGGSERRLLLSSAAARWNGRH